LKIQSELSDTSKEVSQKNRAFFPKFVADTPKYKDIEAIVKFLKEN
jgi:histidine ammonia-lyase